MKRAMRARLRMRCRACRKNGHSGCGKFTLKNSKAKQVCPRCKSLDVVSMEAAYQKVVARRKKETCYCEGVPHPHQREWHKLCHHFKPHLREGWTEEDLQSYQQWLFENKSDPKGRRRKAHS